MQREDHGRQKIVQRHNFLNQEYEVERPSKPGVDSRWPRVHSRLPQWVTNAPDRGPLALTTWSWSWGRRAAASKRFNNRLKSWLRTLCWCCQYCQATQLRDADKGRKTGENYSLSPVHKKTSSRVFFLKDKSITWTARALSLRLSVKHSNCFFILISNSQSSQPTEYPSCLTRAYNWIVTWLTFSQHQITQKLLKFSLSYAFFSHTCWANSLPLSYILSLWASLLTWPFFPTISPTKPKYIS